MSSTAGKSTPDGMSEFYGYSSATVITGANVLIVAGGGTGGHSINSSHFAWGGGGAGGYLALTTTICSGMSIIVGGGGGDNANGNNSSISGIGTAIGGGKSENYFNGGFGCSGGSGGGGSYRYRSCLGGCGTPGQGNDGGMATCCGSADIRGGGGGGAGSAGSSGQYGAYCNGGSGKAWCNGITYAAGGGGGWLYGNTNLMCANPANGAANSGDGGQGMANYNAGGTYFVTNPGCGGSGIVIIRYPAASKCVNGGTITCSGGYVYHCFTGSGTLTQL
jgi:hypothetical protein